jgi:hypothetical protein
MNDDFLKISYEDLLRDPDLIDRVQRDARRYRAREIGRVLGAAWQALEHPQKPGAGKLRIASCG